MNIVPSGTYKSIRISGDRKVTLKIENDEILSPIKIKYKDGTIEVIHHTFRRRPNISMIDQLKHNILEITETIRDIYSSINK